MSEGFLELKLLVKEMIEGKIQINKPLVITSSDRTKSEELSFLSHVLKYNDVKKETMFVFLNEILEVFNKEMNKLMRNRNVQRYIDGVKGEWDDLSDILFKDLFSEDQVKLMENILENINELCRRFKEINTTVESNNVTDVVEEDDLVDRMDTFVKSIREFNENTEEIMEQLDRYEGNLNKLNTCVLLDLSMKNKKLYLEFNGVTEDRGIPENIQNVFLNYLLILNLIKKQIVYYKKTVKKVGEIADNMEKHTVSTKMTVKSHDKLFMSQQHERGVESYLGGLSD
tara:strand:- start:196 stop:1050 length:855 start_codon:yes stop_codon:yes gene_type:complete